MPVRQRLMAVRLVAIVAAPTFLPEALQFDEPIGDVRARRAGLSEKSMARLPGRTVGAILGTSLTCVTEATACDATERIKVAHRWAEKAPPHANTRRRFLLR